MPTPINSLQNKDIYGMNVTLFPTVGDIFNFQHYTTPVSASGKGGRHYDPIAQTRVKAAAEETKKIIDKVQQQEQHTKRQVANQQHKATKPEPERTHRAQSSYHVRKSYIGELDGIDWAKWVGLLVAAIITYYVIF